MKQFLIKKIALVVLLITTIGAIAQTPTKPTKVEPIRDTKSTTNVPRLDEPNPNKELLDVKITAGKSTKKSSTQVPLLDEPDPNDLLDINIKVPIPTVPNAGKKVQEQIPLTGNYSFNKKVGFMVNSSEGDLTGYFYLNTNNGYAMLDQKGNEALASEKMEGEVTQIKNANNDFLSFIKSSEGNFAMKMGSGQEMVIHDLQTGALSKTFFNSFKKTGKVVKKSSADGIPFSRVEYKGVYEGKTMYIWLSDPQGILLDTRFTFAIAGYWGLGFIASPSGKTYMITGIQGDGSNIFMTYFVNENRSFSGAGYKPMGDVYKDAMANMSAENKDAAAEMYKEAAKEEDSQLRAIKLEQAKKMDQLMKQHQKGTDAFSSTSDLKDLPALQSQDMGNAVFDMQISALKEAVRTLEISNAEMKKQGGDANSKAILSNQCLIACNKAELARMEKLKAAYVDIQKKHKNDTEKANDDINRLMENHANNIQPCNCN